MSEEKDHRSPPMRGRYSAFAGTDTAGLTIVHAIAWPTVALIIFLCARSPVTHILNAVAEKLQGVGTMYVGKLELRFDRETPHPADDVVHALRMLSVTEVERILKHSYREEEGCKRSNEVPNNLVQTGLLERKMPGDCAVATDLGIRTRAFLFSLVAAEVGSIAKTSE